MKYCFIFLALLISKQAASQDLKGYKKDSAKIKSCLQNVIQIPQHSSDSNLPVQQLPVGKFVVEDVRFDTSSIGMQVRTTAFFYNNYFRKLTLDKSLSESITERLNNSKFQLSQSELSFVCFVKQFYLMQSDSLDKKSKNKELYNALTLNTEVYIDKAGMYYPAFKLDTTLLSVTDSKNEFVVLDEMLNMIGIKAARVDTAKAFARKADLPSDVAEKYRKQFDKPILMASEPAAGVYSSFAEFVNSSPSVKEFKMVKDHKSTSLFSKTPQKDWTIETKAFGFSDGHCFWLNVDNVFYPLIRQGNTFEFLGEYYDVKRRSGTRTQTTYTYSYQNIANLNNSAAPLASEVMFNTILNLFPPSRGRVVVHQLNMENGNFY